MSGCKDVSSDGCPVRSREPRSGYVGSRGGRGGKQTQQVQLCLRPRRGRRAGNIKWHNMLYYSYYCYCYIFVSSVQWLQQLPHILSLPQYNLLAVHAGLLPPTVRSIDNQLASDCIKMRNIVTVPQQQQQQQQQSDGGGGGEPLLALVGVETGGDKLGVPWASLWPGPEHVFFGHDAKRGADGGDGDDDGDVMMMIMMWW